MAYFRLNSVKIITSAKAHEVERTIRNDFVYWIKSLKWFS